VSPAVLALPPCLRPQPLVKQPSRGVPYHPQQSDRRLDAGWRLCASDLLQAGGVEQLVARAEHGATPLHLAGSANPVEEVCVFLIQAGGPEQLVCLDDDGATAAAVARRCNPSLVRSSVVVGWWGRHHPTESTCTRERLTGQPRSAQ
jgi:hypothetical protein